jgi:hypothetical protein
MESLHTKDNHQNSRELAAVGRVLQKLGKLWTQHYEQSMENKGKKKKKKF